MISGEKKLVNNKTNKGSFFGRSPVYLWVTLGFILILGLGIRLYDLTDPPLDFHSTRQLWSAIIARGIYYQGEEEAPTWQRVLAVEAWKAKPAIEPIIFETVVAFTYRLVGSEILSVPRIYASLFWTIGGLGLYFLVRDLTSIDAGVTALLFYTFVPFGAIASRSFQPDPLMVMWIILAWWAFYRWYQSPSWKAAILSGFMAGMAMLTKSVAVFMLLGGMAALLGAGPGIKWAVKDRQVWGIALLSALPVVTYTLYGLYALEIESQFQGRFFPELLLDPSHYVRWAAVMISIVGFAGLFLSLIGLFLFSNKTQRAFVLGLWVGYVLYGLFFPYHFLTHNYYHLPLIPLVALSLSPVAESLFNRVVSLGLNRFAQLGISGVILVGVVWQMWDIRVELAQRDYRHEPGYWEALGDKIGHDAKVVALTQDYGDRLLFYGWLMANNWPETGHLAYRDLRGGKAFEFEEWFAKETKDMDYFLVTRIKELDRQSELKDTLYNHYAIAAEGDGFILFDLNHHLP